MNSVATKCEVVEAVEIEIDTTNCKAHATKTDSDKHAEAVSFRSAEDCTLLFLNAAVFDTEYLFMEGGIPKTLKVVGKNKTTEVRVLLASTLVASTHTAGLLVRPQVQVCGGPKIIVP